MPQSIGILTQTPGSGGGGGGVTTNDYGFPSYTTLMARANKINVAATAGADAYTETIYGTGIGADCTLNLEGWRGHPNGGVTGLTWLPSHAYIVGDPVKPTTANGHAYKCTTAGTSASTEGTWPTGTGTTKTSGGAVFTEVGLTTGSNPTVLRVGSFNPGINGVNKLALLGSNPATSSANVGRVDGADWNNAQNLFPLDPYRWAWQDRKNLGGWTGPNLDEHAVRLSTNVEVDGSWSGIIDGMLFRDLNDAVGVGAQNAARTIYRNCAFVNVGDDCQEGDFNNNSAEYYDCLFLNVYTIFSTTGSRNASAEQSLLKNCVVAFGHLPWKTTTTGITCPGVGLRDLTGTDGRYWAHGVIYKQPSSNSPRFRMEDTTVFIPGWSSACRTGTGLSGATFASAANTTLRFGRGKATTAGNGQAIPLATIGLEDWNTAFMPAGVTITNDSTSSYENTRDSAVQSWIDGTAGHNPHPQFAGLLT